jgi:hypothetical protein
MYLETGLGQPTRRRKRRVISPPRVGPADQLLIAEMKWGLKVPFRKDFGAFRQEMAKAIGRHIIKNASDITKADDWILKRPENEQRLKAIHNDLLKLAKKEADSVIVRTRYTFLQGVDTVISTVEIVGANY